MEMVKSDFFDEAVIAGASEYPEQPQCDFGFRATSMMIAVDGPGPIEYSFDGRDRHGKVYKADKFIALDDIDHSKLWLRCPGGTNTSIRVWAWSRQK